jgi:hypothetical protein
MLGLDTMGRKTAAELTAEGWRPVGRVDTDDGTNPNSDEDTVKTLIGNGVTNFLSTVSPGNTIIVNGDERGVIEVTDDKTLIIDSKWTGGTSKGSYIWAKGKLPLVGGEAAGALAVNPLWKNPVVIIAIVGGALLLAYYLINRRK